MDRHPDLPVVIDHGAKPLIAQGVMRPWADDMARLARDTGALCKLSGLATEAAEGWTPDDLRPYVDHLLDTFGPDRLMFGSDWPVLNLAGEYGAWARIARDAVRAHGPSAEAAVFGGTGPALLPGPRRVTAAHRAAAPGRPVRRNRFIYDTLRDAIRRDRLEPGQILTESALARFFDVSRAPAAEALSLAGGRRPRHAP